jgi:hypothetical protein
MHAADEAGAQLLADAPTANLFVELPKEGVLQMCVMRPTPTEVCPPLPLLVPFPEPQELAATLFPPRLFADDALHEKEMQREPATTCSNIQPNPDGGVAIIRATEQALRQQRELPEALRNLDVSDWQAYFASAAGDRAVDTAPPFSSLNPKQLESLIHAAQSEELCDLLLARTFPFWLRSASESHAAATSEELEQIDSATLPLPSPLTGIILLLIRHGRSLRLSVTEFEQQVVQPLYSLPVLGERAAAQASLIYAANVQNATLA